MKARKLLFVAVLSGMTVMGLAPRATAQSLAMKLVHIGDEAPDFTLEEFSSGKPISLGDYLGKKVVMLEFWATWCDICKSEMPRLQKEYSEYRERGYELLAITLSRGDKKDREKIQALKEKYGLTYPLLMDTEFEVATKIYGLSGPIPLKAIIDCQGKLRYSHVGDYADGISEVPFVLDELLSDPECNP
jgi:peroxiredoxin